MKPNDQVKNRSSSLNPFPTSSASSESSASTAGTALPDVALQATDSSELQWVGMENIQVPVKLTLQNQSILQSAKVSAQVSLDKKMSRGIHMSRLYMAVQQRLPQQNFGFAVLMDTVRDFLNSHQELSSKARIVVETPILFQKSALKSPLRSFRSYPTRWTLQKLSPKNTTSERESFEFSIRIKVHYSSTCPASAALSRESNTQDFMNRFADSKNLNFTEIQDWLRHPEGMRATPHAQRSLLDLQLKWRFNVTPESSASPEMSVKNLSSKEESKPVPTSMDSEKLRSLIEEIEEVLQTPVQGAVKREDEQEFARRNGQNLMFCEDAARRVQNLCEQWKKADSFHLFSYRGKVSHLESLHPHDAVAYFQG